MDFFHPATDEDQRKVRLKYNLHMPYVLFVGSLEPRKNLAWLINSWRKFSLLKEGLELVVAGTNGAAFRRDPPDWIPPEVKLLGYVPDEDLPGLYSGAEVFILPSRYEGFGLTALEAMACGTPVITLRAAALPEVVGDAGWLIDSKNDKSEEAEEIAWATHRLTEDTDLREEYSKKGLEQARKFSWDKTARDTLAVLEQV
jgi:glycosyltransferase involved in cell wall biosynthesis